MQKKQYIPSKAFINIEVILLRPATKLSAEQPL